MDVNEKVVFGVIRIHGTAEYLANPVGPVHSVKIVLCPFGACPFSKKEC